MYYLRTAPAALVSLSALNTFFAVFTHSNLHLFIQHKQLTTADVFTASPLCNQSILLKANNSYFLISQFASKPSGHPLSSVSVPVICSRRSQPFPGHPVLLALWVYFGSLMLWANPPFTSNLYHNSCCSSSACPLAAAG